MLNLKRKDTHNQLKSYRKSQCSATWAWEVHSEKQYNWPYTSKCPILAQESPSFTDWFVLICVTGKITIVWLQRWRTVPQLSSKQEKNESEAVESIFTCSFKCDRENIDIWQLYTITGRFNVLCNRTTVTLFVICFYFCKMKLCKEKIKTRIIQYYKSFQILTRLVNLIWALPWLSITMFRCLALSVAFGWCKLHEGV